MEKVYLLYMDSEGAEDFICAAASVERAKIEARNKAIEEAQLSEEDAATFAELEWDEVNDGEFECEVEITEPDDDDPTEEQITWEGLFRIEEHVVLA